MRCQDGCQVPCPAPSAVPARAYRTPQSKQWACLGATRLNHAGLVREGLKAARPWARRLQWAGPCWGAPVGRRRRHGGSMAFTPHASKRWRPPVIAPGRSPELIQRLCTPPARRSPTRPPSSTAAQPSDDPRANPKRSGIVGAPEGEAIFLRQRLAPRPDRPGPYGVAPRAHSAASHRRWVEPARGRRQGAGTSYGHRQRLRCRSSPGL